ncbi:uncharacterized protein LOC130714518 [Lotus japonicus]|uniref:uncharacterized protein LOC130714518 n=1 Tax=Lotus japonicus TaxID=34305 RepID=UPI002586B090|nr:uncharacterized protein LOC130714518 [Lotus japonicus]
MAWQLGHRQVVCYSDSLLAVTLIQEPPSHFHEFAVLINNICDLLRKDWVVRIEHVLREGNACADFLAKAGVNQDLGFLHLQDPLPGMEHLILADSLGMVTVRQ